MILTKCNTIFWPITFVYAVPITYIFRHNNKITQIDHFELTLHYKEMPNLLIIGWWGHKHDPRTQTKELNIKWLTFWDSGLRKSKKKYFSYGNDFSIVSSFRYFDFYSLGYNPMWERIRLLFSIVKYFCNAWDSKNIFKTKYKRKFSMFQT